ncbi:anthrone oxygenase family protein [Nocardia jejuensis]|uniref:anthrone oxygenase family protein n=1 Tax=Nocardia jejuensis TaxID=328049 RepID=UPI000A01E2CB|nr:anthrone oxygenase family protein [Nocardia jejuensis]
MFALRMAALVAATLSSGLIAGLFYGYANSVMPALNQSDDRTIVDVMQRINVVIINPWFMIGFMGTVGFSILAAALHLGKDVRTTLIWISVGLVLNLIAFMVTSGLNVPLNNQLAAAGDVGQIGDLAAVRAQFETSWVRWNIVRAVLHTLAFLALIGALFVAGVQHGRADASGAAAGAGHALAGQSGFRALGNYSAPIVARQQYVAPAGQQAYFQAPRTGFAPGQR